MRSMTCASMTFRPSSPRLDAKVPGMTLNRTKISSATARMIGTVCRTRRKRKANIGSRPDSRVAGEGRQAERMDRPWFGRLLRGRRGLVDPEALVILERELGRVRLQALEPGLIGHHRLVVVEEPHRRLLLDDGVDLLQVGDLLCRIVHRPGLVEKLVDLGVLEGGVVAGRGRRRGVEALQRRLRVGT